MKSNRSYISIILILLIFCLPSIIRGQKVNITDFVKDTQKIKQDIKHMTILWWIPNEFWNESFKNDPSVSNQMSKEVIEIVNKYIILVVIDEEIGSFGGLTPTSKIDIIQNISVRLYDNNILKPLKDDEITQDAKNLFSMMKPMFANMLGQLGSAIEFFAFDGLDEKGNRYLNPKKENRFSVQLFGEDYNWRLPLGSLLPQKIDPKTKEIFPGNYNYNPFTGTELIINE